jgi:hypothetical protein
MHIDFHSGRPRTHWVPAGRLVTRAEICFHDAFVQARGKPLSGVSYLICLYIVGRNDSDRAQGHSVPLLSPGARNNRRINKMRLGRKAGTFRPGHGSTRRAGVSKTRGWPGVRPGRGRRPANIAGWKGGSTSQRLSPGQKMLCSRRRPGTRPFDRCAPAGFCLAWRRRARRP